VLVPKMFTSMKEFAESMVAIATTSREMSPLPTNLPSLAPWYQLNRQLLTLIPLTQAHTLEAQFTKSAKVTVTHSSSISFGQDISIHSNALGIGVDNSYEFKIGNSAGSESTSSNTITISDTETVTVPPNHGMNLN